MPGHFHFLAAVCGAPVVLEEGCNGDTRHLTDQPNQHAHLHHMPGDQNWKDGCKAELEEEKKSDFEGKLNACEG